MADPQPPYLLDHRPQIAAGGEFALPLPRQESLSIEDLIGRTLGHYRIVEQIGAGGMGVVYRAHDERLDRDVAIKVLPEEVAGDADRLSRFEREAKALAALSHPNIAMVFGLEKFESGRETETGTGQAPSVEPRAPGFFLGWRSQPKKKPGRETRRDQGYENWSWEAGASSDG
jgi:serine/threonine protein kinase